MVYTELERIGMYQDRVFKHLIELWITYAIMHTRVLLRMEKKRGEFYINSIELIMIYQT